MGFCKRIYGFLTVFVVAALLLGCASHQPSIQMAGDTEQAYDQALNLPLPESLVGVPYRGMVDYERMQRGLGVGYKYANAKTHIDIFRYDKNLADIGDGLNAIVQAEFSAAQDGITTAVAMGRYEKAESRRSEKLTIGSYDYWLHTAKITRQGKVYSSYLLITARNNHFFKIRMSTERDPTSIGQMWQALKNEWLITL